MIAVQCTYDQEELLYGNSVVTQDTGAVFCFNEKQNLRLR